MCTFRVTFAGEGQVGCGEENMTKGLCKADAHKEQNWQACTWGQRHLFCSAGQCTHKCGHSKHHCSWHNTLFLAQQLPEDREQAKKLKDCLKQRT